MVKIKSYTKEQLDNGEIVLVKFNYIHPIYHVLPVEVVKSTAKQMVIRGGQMERTLTFEKFGTFDWGGIYCLREDVEAIIKDYKVLKSAQIKEKIDTLNRELAEVEALKLEGGI